MSYYSSGNSFQRGNPVVFGLIVANVIVFVLQLMLSKFNITESFALHYYNNEGFKPHQIITNFFIHSPIMFSHILFNMFCLYTFGTWLEKAWGSKRFFSFYMICGVGASIILIFSMPFSADLYAQSAEGLKRFMGNTPAAIEDYLNTHVSLGASGAIMGVEVAFAYLFPNTELMMMFIPVPIKAKFLIPGFILLDLFGGFTYSAGDNVGHFAHLGGALIGFLLVFYWNKTNKKTFY
jgi:membrane associated rhomboid family serine protease